MKLHLVLGGAAVASLGLAAAAIAGDPAPSKGGGPEERREERIIILSGDGPGGGMDANGDGDVTRAEFRAMHDRMFDKLDKNRDGKLSREEMRGGAHGPGGPGSHGPGMIWMERDEDGDAAPGERREVRVVRHGGPGGEGGLDANKDGKVSFEEFAAPLRDAFKESDRNNSGFLEGDELNGTHKLMIRTERRE